MSDETIRAFVAVDLSPEARAAAGAAIGALAAAVEAEVRWIAPENLHLTVKFLGQVACDRVPELVRRLAARLAGVEAFTVELGGLGAFPSARAARVLWLGVGEGASELARLARKADGAAARLGLPRERRPYRAHLTLGRLRVPARVPLERVEPPSPVTFPVRQAVLYQSRPREAAGLPPEYLPLARLPLGREAAAAFDFAPEI